MLRSQSPDHSSSVIQYVVSDLIISVVTDTFAHTHIGVICCPALAFHLGMWKGRALPEQSHTAKYNVMPRFFHYSGPDRITFVSQYAMRHSSSALWLKEASWLNM